MFSLDHLGPRTRAPAIAAHGESGRGRRSGRTLLRIAARVLGVALVASTITVCLLWWRSDADTCTCDWCPDHYCAYAEAMRVAVAGEPAGWQRLAAFGREYVHAHSPLVPALMVPGLLAGLSPVAAYALVSGFATLLAWLAVRRSITAAFRPGPLVVGLAFAIFFSNALVVRTFARPMTDAAGLACTAWSLCLLQRWLEAPSRARSLRLVAAQSLGLFSRVSFIPMTGLPALAALARAHGSARDRVVAALRAGLLYGVLPAGVFLTIAGALGIQHVREAWDYAHHPAFQQGFQLVAWRRGLWLAGGPLLALGVTAGALGEWQNSVWRVQALWVVLYLGFLASGQGTPHPRYFVPIVPSLLIAATPCLQRIARRSVAAAWLSAGVAIAPGLLQIHRAIDHRAESVALLAAEAGFAAAGAPLAEENRIARGNFSIRSFAATDGRGATGIEDGGRHGWKTIFQVDLSSSRRVGAIGFPRPIGTGRIPCVVEGSADGSSWMSIGDGSIPPRLSGFFAMHPQMLVALRPAGRLQSLRVLAPVENDAEWKVEDIALYRPSKSDRRRRAVERD